MSTALAEKTFRKTMCGEITQEDVNHFILLDKNTGMIARHETATAVLSDGVLADGNELRAQVISLPRFNSVPKVQSSPFEVLQEWEGVVTEVRDRTFVASLLDVTRNRAVAEEEAEFPIDDLTDDHKRQLRPGAVFCWIIGYRSIAGTKERSSKIVFRRLPAWNRRDLTLAKKKAHDLSKSITWE